MNDTQTPVKTRKTRYDLNFKRSAVELWQSSGKSAAAVATELGISGQTLKTWKQQALPAAAAQHRADHVGTASGEPPPAARPALRPAPAGDSKKTLGILASPSDHASSL